MVRPAQFLGSLQGYQPTLPAPPSRTRRVPAQPWALALASDLRSHLAVYFLNHGRLFAADGPSTSTYTTNALLPMSDGDFDWMGKRYPGMHAPLISKDLFTRVQEVLTEKGQHRSHQQ